MTVQPTLDLALDPWLMVMQFGVYVGGEWVEWLPARSTEHHGWESPAEAVAFWRHPDRAHTFRGYRNGRETLTNFTDGAAPVFQRVWFEQVSHV